MVPQSEVVMICEFTGEVHDEALSRFDGTYSKEGTCDKIRKCCRRFYFPRTFAKGPEHKVLMGMPREPTIFNEVNKVGLS